MISSMNETSTMERDCSRIILLVQVSNALPAKRKSPSRASEWSAVISQPKILRA